MYDIIIVGGGISGLYLAYKLQYNYKILLIEKSNYLGGRIHTYVCNVENKKCRYEAGAGRIASNHKLMLKLVEELGFKDKLVQVPTSKKHIHNYTTNYKKYYPIDKDEKLDIKFLIGKILENRNNYSKNLLSNNLFIDYIYDTLSPGAAKFLVDSFGYKAEFFSLNAYDGLRLFKNDFNEENSFYIVSGGLSLVVNKLVEKLTNVTIKKRLLVEDFTYKNNAFKIKTKGLFKSFNFRSKKLIFATNKQGLSRIDSFSNNNRISNLINSVKEIPMARIYAIFRPKNGKVWFNDIGKITTNGPIQYIIPINKVKGIIMISYPDLDNALFWKNKNLDGKLKKEVMQEIRKMFPSKTIDDPIYLKMHFWHNGVHYFKKGYPSYNITNKIIQPFKQKPLYITGEAYSKRQAWIEGALETSEIVLKKILSSNKKGGVKDLPIITKKELSKHNTLDSAWTAIDGYVLDITNWIPKHPGGTVILNSLGKDYTEKWWDIPAHSIEIVNNIFPKYVIGVLK